MYPASSSVFIAGIKMGHVVLLILTLENCSIKHTESRHYRYSVYSQLKTTTFLYCLMRKENGIS